MIKKIYRTIRNIINKKSGLKYMPLEEESKYLVYNEIFDYSQVDISKIDERFRDNYNFLKNWKSDSYIMHYPEVCWIEPIFGYAITKDKKYLLHSKPNSYRPIIFDSTWGGTPPPDKFVFELKKRKAKDLGVAISLNYQENFGKNYFFVFDQIIGQLWLLKQHGVDLSLPVIIPKSIYDTKFFQQIKDVCTFLSNINWIVRNDINYDFKHAEYFKCQELYCARTNCYTNKHLVPVVSLFDSIQADNKDTKNRKIFLTRSIKRARHLKNNEEIEQLLKKLGFEIIDTDNLSFIDQIKLFRNVSELIALHGAGNINMIFRYPQKMKFLEIHTPDWPGAGYVIMASEMGYDYDVYWGTKLDSNNAFYIDPKDFENKVINWMK